MFWMGKSLYLGIPVCEVIDIHRGGGLITYIKENLNFKRWSDLDLAATNNEILWL